MEKENRSELEALIEKSRSLGPMTDEDKREQRISFVFGNCKLSNPDVMREMVEVAVDFGTATGACKLHTIVGHNSPDGILPSAPIFRRNPSPEGCEDCSGCPDCYTNDQPCDCFVNPIASLRSERKIKSGKAAKLLGISRQRLYVVEHAQRELPCMERLLEKAQRVWREEE